MVGGVNVGLAWFFTLSGEVADLVGYCPEFS